MIKKTFHFILLSIIKSPMSYEKDLKRKGKDGIFSMRGGQIPSFLNQIFLWGWGGGAKDEKFFFYKPFPKLSFQSPRVGVVEVIIRLTCTVFLIICCICQVLVHHRHLHILGAKAVQPHIQGILINLRKNIIC